MRESNHTPTPWMTQPCGELLPHDVMIVADFGKNSDGIQCVSTVARALSIRQTPETTKENAEFIVRAANSHNLLVEALHRCVIALRSRDQSEYEAKVLAFAKDVLAVSQRSNVNE